MNTVRDGLWLWGHEAGSHNSGWGLPAESTITPPQAAEYMGMSGLVMVVYGGKPEPPFDKPAREMASLERVVWSIVGDLSSSRNNEQTDLDEIIRMAPSLPNLTGAIIDDFFHEPDASGSFSRFTPSDLASFRSSLHSACRPLELWIVTYEHDLDLPIRAHIEQCDVITFWTPRARDLPGLPESFSRLEAVAPGKKRVLGCYMWDYGTNQPMPVEMMRLQCEVGLGWLRAGRIDGIIFLASCICDLGLEAVEWTRNWISEVGELAAHE